MARGSLLVWDFLEVGFWRLVVVCRCSVARRLLRSSSVRVTGVSVAHRPVLFGGLFAGLSQGRRAVL